MMPALPTVEPRPPARPVPQEVASLAATLRLSVTRLARRLRQQDDSGITPSMLSVLSTLRGGPLTLGELASVERIQPPTLTPIVARLEDSGLVTREADASDRRVSRVAISVNGRQLLDRARSRKTAYLAIRLRRLDPEDRAVLEAAAAILERLAGDDA